MQSRAEEALTRHSLQAILEKIDVATFIARGDGAVHYANSLGNAHRATDPAALRHALRAAIAGEGAATRYSCTRLDVNGWYLLCAPGGEPMDRAQRRMGLTPRQREVVELVVGGATNRTIAEVLGIAERTVEVHLSSIYERAGVENRASLVSLVLRAD